jgi:hypothetical protein
MKLSRTNPEKEERRLKDLAWANFIKERDGWACSICGSIYGPCAHHIIPREIEEYRYMWDNGITLCVKCHKFSRIISAHNNPLAFMLWLKRFRTTFFLLAEKRTKELLRNEGVILDNS